MPVSVLTIAGSDSSGGAGIQADLKTFRDHGVHGSSVITAVTAQNTTGVQGVNFLPPDFVAEQIASVARDIQYAAVKLGMLGNEAIADRVAATLVEYRLQRNLVIDPVMVSASGDILLTEAAIKVYRESLLPLATLATPNLREASILTGSTVETPAQMEKAARRLYDMGAGAVLLKGGDGSGDVVVDILYDGTYHYFESTRLPGKFHGTGCTLSAAIAACLARGESLPAAVKLALDYLHSKLRNPLSPGKGAPIPG